MVSDPSACAVRTRSGCADDRDGEGQEEQNWTGTSATRIVDGKVIPKKTAPAPFLVHTTVAVAGLVLVVRYAGLSWPLHILGIALALGGTVASHGYRS